MQTVGGAQIDGVKAVWAFTNLNITFESALQQIDEGSVVIATQIAVARNAANRPKGPKL